MTPEVRRRRLNNVTVVVVFGLVACLLGFVIGETNLLLGGIFLGLLAQFMQARVLHPEPPSE